MLAQLASTTPVAHAVNLAARTRTRHHYHGSGSPSLTAALVVFGLIVAAVVVVYFVQKNRNR